MFAATRPEDLWLKFLPALLRLYPNSSPNINHSLSNVLSIDQFLGVDEFGRAHACPYGDDIQTLRNGGYLEGGLLYQCGSIIILPTIIQHISIMPCNHPSHILGMVQNPLLPYLDIFGGITLPSPAILGPNGSQGFDAQPYPTTWVQCAPSTGETELDFPHWKWWISGRQTWPIGTNQCDINGGVDRCLFYHGFLNPSIHTCISIYFF